MMKRLIWFVPVVNRGVARRGGRRLGLLLASLMLVSVISPPAQGAIVTYSDVASFNNATSGGITTNFDSLSPTNSFAFFGNTVTTNGLTFSTSGNANLFAIGRDFDSPLFAFGSANVVLQDNTNPSNLTVSSLPAGTTAFAVDVGLQVANSGLLTTVTLSTGDTFTFNAAARPGLQFEGFTSDAAITSVTFSTQSFGLSFADVTTAQAVPAPPGLVLACIGALCMGGYSWRRKAKAAVA